MPKIVKIVLGIEYQGTNYCGWQLQDHCDSVQENLQKALSFVANEAISLFCAGRTDTAVHAVGQVVHFETTAIRPDRAWTEGVNTQLPRDIRVIWVKNMENMGNVSEDFHARFSAVARQYRYVIFNRPVNSAVLASRVTWVSNPLDEVKMHVAVQDIMGQQDFSSFRASSCQAKNANREIQQISVTRRGDFVFLDLQANAFLHHMVRNISGSLIAVGKGDESVTYMKDLLLLKNRQKAGVTAPAAGLYFVNAIYPDKWDIPKVPVNEVLWG